MVVVDEGDEVACGAMVTVGGECMADDDCDYAWVWQMDPVDDCDEEMEVTGKMGLVWKASPLSLHMIVWESLLTPTVSYKFHSSSLLANAHVLLLNLSWKCTRISPPEIIANSLAFTIKDFFRSFRRFRLEAVSGSKAITHGPEWRGGALALFEVLKKMSQGRNGLNSVTIALNK